MYLTFLLFSSKNFFGVNLDSKLFNEKVEGIVIRTCVDVHISVCVHTGTGKETSLICSFPLFDCSNSTIHLLWELKKKSRIIHSKYTQRHILHLNNRRSMHSYRVQVENFHILVYFWMANENLTAKFAIENPVRNYCTMEHSSYRCMKYTLHTQCATFANVRIRWMKISENNVYAVSCMLYVLCIICNVYPRWRL